MSKPKSNAAVVHVKTNQRSVAILDPGSNSGVTQELCCHAGFDLASFTIFVLQQTFSKTVEKSSKFARRKNLILLLGFFEEANINLTPTTVFQFEISTSPLDMERGGEVLELRSVGGVSLKRSQALEYFSLLLNIVEIGWKT